MDKVARPTVVFSLVGTTLDAGVGEDRWNWWRPSVSLCQHEDLLVSRLELLFDRKHTKVAKQLLADVATVSPETEVGLRTISMAAPWDFEAVFDELHRFTQSYTFDTEREDYLVHITTGTHVAQICLFLLTETRHFPARLIQTAPPRREQPGAGSFQIIDLDLSRYDRIATRFQEERRDALSFLKSGIDTRNTAFNELMERIERVAIASKAPILLTGPTGSGKSRLARRIYDLKLTRRLVAGPLVEVNCATIRGDAAMSALFGHRRGAFTGAIADRPGLLRSARGGVLFLDEIGELGLDEQAMLLRAVEDKRFLPVGSDREEESDFQLIAGSNCDLWSSVRDGRFREDLLARLDLWPFRLPGLVDRLEDIEPNVDYELERFAQTAGRKTTFNREARDRFLRFATSRDASWSANFRDLNAAVTRMSTLASSGRITVRGVDDEIARLKQAWRASTTDNTPLIDQIVGPTTAAGLDRFDRVQLEEVLRTCARSTSLSDAGRALFGESRKRRSSTNDADRLRKYLARFDLNWETMRRHWAR